MGKRVVTDTPLAEITLRRYEKPYKLEKRELVKKICLSLGLLQPGDSRDVMVDVFMTILLSKKPMIAEDVRKSAENIRTEHSLPLTGLASSNIRRQLKRLRDASLIEKKANRYRLTEGENLTSIFQEKIENVVVPAILERVRSYISQCDQEFGRTD